MTSVTYVLHDELLGQESSTRTLPEVLSIGKKITFTISTSVGDDQFINFRRHGIQLSAVRSGSNGNFHYAVTLRGKASRDDMKQVIQAIRILLEDIKPRRGNLRN